MTDPTTAIDTTRLRELLRTASSFRSQSMRTAALGVLRKEAARNLPALLDQLTAQAEIADKLNREIDDIQDQWKAERNATKARLAAQAAEIERVREERDEARRFGEEAARRYNALLVEKRRVTCVYCGHQYPDGTPEAQDAALTEHIRTCEKHPMRAADARVAELKGLLREIRDSYHDNRAGGWPGAGDVFADAICRIDAALSNREGGR